MTLKQCLGKQERTTHKYTYKMYINALSFSAYAYVYMYIYATYTHIHKQYGGGGITREVTIVIAVWNQMGNEEMSEMIL